MAGEAIRYFFDLLIPGSIIGMVLIFVSLRLNWIRLDEVKLASDILLKYLALFFVPYGVGLMTYYKLIRNDLSIILFAIVLSSIISFYITAFLMRKYGRE